MNPLATIFSLLFFFCLAMVVASLITPRAAWLIKNKNRKKGALSWLGTAFICFFIFVVIAPPPEPKAELAAPVRPASQAAEPVAIANPSEVELNEPTSIELTKQTQNINSSDDNLNQELQESDFDEDALVARKAMAARADEVKPELQALYQELENLLTTKGFKDFGFSGKFKPATDWKNRVEECRTRLEADKSLPIQVRVVPSYLLGLATSLIWNEGQVTESAKWDIQMIEDGLNWKWND